MNMPKQGTYKTFSEYSSLLFLPYLQAQLQHASRLDIVWDVHIPNSLKATARGNREGGIRRRVQATNQLPRDWNGFLRVDENKTELFKFLAEETVTLGGEKQIISTLGDQVICYPPRVDVSNLAPCSHEEADTRMLLYAADAANPGFRKIVIRTVDTDVVVLSVAAVPKFQPAELWLAFGVGDKFRYLPAHEISQNIGQEMSEALPFFRALTGCDTVSCFAGRGKKTAWTTWKLFKDATKCFLSLSHSPCEVTDVDMETVERFVVLSYDRTSTKGEANEARQQLFAQRGRSLDAIPPTKAALVQHTRRAAYQVGHCWGQLLKFQPQLPCPGDWGWSTSASGCKPLWTTLDDVTSSC